MHLRCSQYSRLTCSRAWLSKALAGTTPAACSHRRVTVLRSAGRAILNLTDNGAKSLTESINNMPEVTLRLANGEIYPEKGKVATVSGVINNTTGAATVRALFNNKTGMLRSGSTGQVLIPNKFEQVIVIPQGATNELQNIRFAYVVNDSNKVVSTPIQVSPNDDGKNFIVMSGLEPGQRIAVEGIGTKVRDGVTIQPVDASAKTAPQQPSAAQ